MKTKILATGENSFLGIYDSETENVFARTFLVTVMIQLARSNKTNSLSSSSI
jgi:hypothetical protein